MKLTIKATIRWEQLNKKPFSQIDYGSENDVLSLFYTCGDMADTFGEFKKGVSDEAIRDMAAAFTAHISVTAQFQSAGKSDKKDDAPDVYIKDIVPLLVMNGLDVYYAFNDMELCDLPLFLEAYDQKTKDRLTAGRMWAFLQLSPHLKEGTTAKDVYPFPWEVEMPEDKAAEAKKEFEAFMKTGLTK